MTSLIEAIQAGIDPKELLHYPLPETYRAAYLLASESDCFCGSQDKDVRRSIHVGEVPLPDIEPDEVLVAVMAAAINFNTVWSAQFEPVSTFRFLAQFGRQGRLGARHDLPYHVLGSDAAGIVVRAGSIVRKWAVGDHVVIHPAYIDQEDPVSQQDGMMTSDLRAWGYETNFGGLADFTLVKANQLLAKAPHLSWEEAACIPLCSSTAYRMLVSRHGAQMKQGDIVLIWGATGGLGAFAVQLVKNGGGIPVGVVNSVAKVELARTLGCAAVLNRAELGLSSKNGQLTQKTWLILKKEILRQIGEEPHIVFEYPGRETFAASVYLARRGGVVVTCGSSSGYLHEYDNRYLWMNLKTIIGTHGANYQEAWEVNRLVHLGMLAPTLSATYSLDEVGEATRLVQLNHHVGKVGIRCLALQDGLGIQNSALRQRMDGEILHQFRTYCDY